MGSLGESPLSGLGVLNRNWPTLYDVGLIEAPLP
jgi:hypothetical protein